MEKIILKFYKIDRCGYYKYKDNKTYLTNISDTLEDLKNWLNNKTLQETLTTDVLSKTEQLPVYCIDVSKSEKGNFLITTWNKLETTEGGISSIPINEPLKSAAKNVTSTPLPENNIPGYATYFYVIPKDNILATIRFNHISNGHRGLNSYLKGFLTKYSKYVQVNIDKTDKTKIKILGYGNTKNDCSMELHPYFKTLLKKNRTNIQRILSNVSNISKIIRKTTVTSIIEEEKSFILDLMKHIGINSQMNKNEEFKLKYEMNLTPNINNVKEIIKSWQKEDSWDDIGFKIKGENNPIWLSADIPSQAFELDIKRDNPEFINFDSLLTHLDDKLDLIKKVYID